LSQTEEAVAQRIKKDLVAVAHPFTSPSLTRNKLEHLFPADS